MIEDGGSPPLCLWGLSLGAPGLCGKDNPPFGAGRPFGLVPFFPNLKKYNAAAIISKIRPMAMNKTRLFFLSDVSTTTAVSPAVTCSSTVVNPPFVIRTVCVPSFSLWQAALRLHQLFPQVRRQCIRLLRKVVHRLDPLQRP